MTLDADPHPSLRLETIVIAAAQTIGNVAEATVEPGGDAIVDIVLK